MLHVPWVVVSGISLALFRVGLTSDSGRFALLTILIQSSGECAGHSNAKNFVGCSVTADGYIATGSEDNALYCYHRSMPTPITRHSFDDAAPPGADHASAVGALAVAGGSYGDGSAAAAAAAHYRDNENPDANQFLSSVTWCRRGGSCIASNSQGHIKVLQLST